jgi:phospholipase C
MFPDHQAVIPYGEQDPADALWTESGSRPVRGILTEGRYLVFQDSGSSKRGLAVSNTRGHSSLSSSSVPTKKESDPALRFIIYEQSVFPEANYQIRSAFLEESSSYLDSDLEFTSKSRAATFTITYNSDGTSYSIQDQSSKKYISISKDGKTSLSSSPFDFHVFAVTF